MGLKRLIFMFLKPTETNRNQNRNETKPEPNRNETNRSQLAAEAFAAEALGHRNGAQCCERQRSCDRPSPNHRISRNVQMF